MRPLGIKREELGIVREPSAHFSVSLQNDGYAIPYVLDPSGIRFAYSSDAPIFLVFLLLLSK